MDLIFDPGLVLYLPFCELDGASFMSKDKHGHLCTVTGALWTPSGGNFDGSDDQISCGTASALDCLAALTIGVWFKTTIPYKSLAGRTNISGAQAAYCLRSDFFTVFETKAQAYPGVRVTSSKSLADGHWHFQVGTWQSGEVPRLWTDGQFNNAGSTTCADLDVVTESFRVGNTNIGATEFFAGLIGELFLYSRALTPLEIQHNYLATKRRYQ